MIEGIIETITSPIIAPIVGTGGALSVANQAFDFGEDTQAAAGSYTLLSSGTTITSAVITSGDASGHWDIASSGDLSPSAAGASAKLNLGPYSLACSYNGGEATATHSVTIQANTYTITGQSNSTTEFDAIETGLVNGDTVIIRKDANLGGIAVFPADSVGLTVKGEDVTDFPTVQFIYVKNNFTGADFTVENIEWDDPRAQLSSRNACVYLDTNGAKFTSTNCLYSGPFDPTANAADNDRPYYAKIDFINGTAKPTEGKTLTNGANSATVYDSDFTAGSGTIWVTDTTSDNSAGWTIGQTLTESDTGETYEVSATKYGGLPDVQQCTGIDMTNGNTNWESVDINNNEFINCTEPVKLKTLDNFDFLNNIIIGFYGDAVKFDPKDGASMPTGLIEFNDIFNFYSTPDDFGDAHPDVFQANAAIATSNWLGVIIRNNRNAQGNTRGRNLHVMLFEIASPYEIEWEITNNWAAVTDSQQGIIGDRMESSLIANNSIVHQDPLNAAGDSVTLTLDNTVDSGGNRAYNNVSDSILLAGWTKGNNVIAGKGGAIIAYSTLFTGNFALPVPDLLADNMARYTPAVGGGLIDGATYVVGDTGCVDSNGDLFLWDPASIPETFNTVFIDDAITGSDVYTTSGTLSGISDGKSGIFYMNIELIERDGLPRSMVRTNDNRVAAFFNGAGGDVNKMGFQLHNGTSFVTNLTSTTYTSASGVLNFLAQWDSDSAGTQSLTVYEGENSRISVALGADDIFDYTPVWYRIGKSGEGLGANVSSFYMLFNPTTQLDITQAATRRLFYDLDGDPTDLSSVSLETPDFQFTGDAAAWNAGTNEGNEGDWTPTGTITDV